MRSERRQSGGNFVFWALASVALTACAGTSLSESGGIPSASPSLASVNADVHAGAPTWYADVLPIVAENCVECHQPRGKNMGGMVAPFSLLTYEDARPWARLMALRVADGGMPPWDAHPLHEGTFIGERYLADADKRTIAEWAEAGALEGDPADAPPSLASLDEVTNTGEWWIGEPDLVMAFAEPYAVEDEAWDVNIDVNLKVPDSHTEARWIKSSELRAGSEHVHHICGEPFGCIAPGWDPYVYPDGYAMLLPPVEEIALGMHYNKPTGPGTAFEDVSRAAVVFYEDGDTIRHVVRRSVLPVGFDFVIPAGHPEYSVSVDFPFAEDTYILSLTPHMHYRGKRAKYELVYPDGRTQLLLWVPEYDFEWQRMYVFKEPPVAPAGSKLVWTPTWDNSTDNPNNPDPTVDVPYGEPTEMEMGNGWMDYTAVAPIEHVIGRDPIPEELLAEVTRQLEARASRQRPRRAVTVDPGEVQRTSHGH